MVNLIHNRHYGYAVMRCIDYTAAPRNSNNVTNTHSGHTLLHPTLVSGAVASLL
jgi:hypothetical protein